MKSAAIFVGVLASAAIAQPHGHSHHRRQHQHGNHKRDLVTEWVTEIETITVTEYIDETTTEWITAGASTVAPSAPTTNVPGQFFEGDTSQAQANPPTPTVVPQPTSEAPAVSETQVYVPPPSSAPVSVPPVQKVPTQAPPPPPTSSQVASSGPSGGSHASDEYTGDLTYYTLGMGACGWDDSGKDLTENIVAISHVLMGEQSNGNPMCGKTISISYGGKTIQATVRDKCMGCAADDIDGMFSLSCHHTCKNALLTDFVVSEIAFTSLMGSTGVGRQVVNWWFN